MAVTVMIIDTRYRLFTLPEYLANKHLYSLKQAHEAGDIHGKDKKLSLEEGHFFLDKLGF